MSLCPKKVDNPDSTVLVSCGNRVSQEADSLSVKVGRDSQEKKEKNSNESNRIKSTKYTLLTFLPMNLFEQFRRVANMYFLIMTVISIVIDSPVSPLTSLVPLVFVIAVTAAKQGYENFLRYRADNMVNFSPVTVIRSGVAEDIRCQDIKRGDIVMMTRDCDIPCDVVLLQSSDENDRCYVTTANLDGETNLKTMSVPKGVPKVPMERLHTIGRIEYELPHTNLYSFKGRIELADCHLAAGEHSLLPLMTENLLLRGSRIKNTEWAIGCAVYTGQQTKLALNSKMTTNKMSSSERYINKYLVFFLVLLVAIVTVSYFLKRYNDRYRQEHNAYLGEILSNYRVSQFLQDYFSFLILFNYLIPISLYVTIEMAKFLGGFYLEWDLEMYDEETDQQCIVNTSDINEELGQVSLLFSDKTGTLTKNVMIFQQCSINGRQYEQKGRRLQESGRRYALKINELSKHVYNFFQALAVCHTVQVAGDYTKEADELLPPATPLQSNMDDRLPMETMSISEEEIVQPPQDGSLHRTGELNDECDRIPTTPVRRHPVSLFEGKNRIVPVEHIDPLASDTEVRRPLRPISLVEPGSVETSFTLEHAGGGGGGGGSNGNLAIPPQLELKRTTSAYEEKPAPPGGQDLKKIGHRRTQSHIPPGMGRPASYLMAVNGPMAGRPVVTLRRNRGSYVSRSVRESYAAPAYNEASVIQRQESQVKRQEIDNFIQKMDYQASSPDEKALVEACARMGLVYVGEDGDRMNIKLRASCVKADVRSRIGEIPVEELVQYERLAVLEFSSDRKRMSIIVRDSGGQIWLYTKGAESHVLPLCAPSPLIETTQRHINEFAKLGLRTLAIARRRLTVQEFHAFNDELIEASSSLTDRTAKIEECQRKIETQLELLGATAVEDALQDNVRDTLQSLGKAGIKIWVLTGDKVETALNIALSCGHIPDGAARYFITDCTTVEQVQQHLDTLSLEMFRQRGTTFALLIDGGSLTIALESLKEQFRDVSIRCHAVLCCRLSPLQKCEVVQLMKTVDTAPVTAAIGDGANDVSMIQEAHVGLGIVGREGRQAARCADYAFAKFCMLKKLLLVHGHFFSTRLAVLVLYFFYKNLVFMGVQLYFQIHSMFSNQSVYDSVFLTLYNVVYTAVPVLVLALTEKPYQEQTLMKNPQLYQSVAGNKQYAWKYFIGWMILGIYHFSVIYFFTYAVWTINPAVYSYWPSTVSFACYGTILIHNVVVLVNLKLLLEAIYKSYIFIATVLLSIFAFMGSTFVYNLLHINYDGSMLQVYNNLLSSMSFWLLSIVILIAGFLPDMTLLAIRAIGVKLGHIFPGGAKYRRALFQWRDDRLQSTDL
ncbi:phospholipid-transporting ATPase IF [Anopheles ziemanni]|uniref:phospholipid-transporting ATPase IF n=1 Tax=Anopheles coustani TaxID=139045 RepID=UPI00265821CF|nr:phospholipid-transporting ATPase IF [Anopheles coustani]XP_058175801.1 phospholipid-transporting ATPase IF [Anopheles ziemanni]